MTEREQNLLDAAQEILSDFNHYGEVLQVDDNGEYGMESTIGMLSAAIHQYNKDTLPDSHRGREPDKVKPTCEDCRLFNPNSISNCDWVGYGTQAENNPCDRFKPKPKPLAQYLAMFIERHKFSFVGIDEQWGEANVEIDVDELKDWLQQALDAYESTENVTIKIERV